MRDVPDLPAETVAAALDLHWGITVESIEYAPVGFGSYHWIATQADRTRWFVTADRVGIEEAFANLEAAYTAASDLRAQGLTFVVAPVAGRNGQLLQRLDAEWAVAVFLYIEGEPVGNGPWEEPDDTARAARIVGQLHTSRPPTALRRFDFAIAFRDTLFDHIDERWDAGPYGEWTRTLLASSRAAVEALLAHYDRLVRTVAEDDDAWVVSHGEEHSANFIAGADGELYLIDWDTLRLAPLERDLESLPIDRPDILEAYQTSAGLRAPRPAGLRLFRAWWHLAEICEYVHRFQQHHDGSADDQESWERLADYLHVEKDWPDLAEYVPGG